MSIYHLKCHIIYTNIGYRYKHRTVQTRTNTIIYTSRYRIINNIKLMNWV